MLPGRKTSAQIHHNTKAKLYPDGSRRVTHCSKAIFRDPGFEPADKPLSNPKAEKRTYNTEGESRKDNVRRAVQAVFDIALLNRFGVFLTFTVAPENLRGVDRNDPDSVRKFLCKWLNNRVQMWPDFQYLLIPEHHKDGAIHCHALAAGVPGLVDSGTVYVPGYSKPIRRETAKRKGIPPEQWHTVYNVPSWTLGHSTAIPLYGESAKVANYVVKYITKDASKIFGKFYLAGGHGLVRKPPVELSDVDFNSVDSKAYDVYFGGDCDNPEKYKLSFKYETLYPEEGGDSECMNKSS